MFILVDSINNRKGVKSAIVEILSMQWPLSLKALHYLLYRKYALNVSYQAVHKAVKQLVEDRVIERDGRFYCLNRCWISKVKNFGRDIDLAYSCKRIPVNEFEVVASLLNVDK